MGINSKYLVFCIAAIALFFVGRCTSPKTENINTHKVDSLKRVIASKHNLAELYKRKAFKAMQRADEAQKVKVVTRTIYITQIAKNHSLPATKKDSLIKEMFHVEYSDSSKFTNPIANGILDLGSENVMLKDNAESDSITIEAKDEGIKELGAALNEITLEGGAKDGLIVEARTETKAAKKEMRKQKRLKWVAIIGIFTVGTLAVISN